MTRGELIRLELLLREFENKCSPTPDERKASQCLSYGIQEREKLAREARAER